MRPLGSFNGDSTFTLLVPTTCDSPLGRAQVVNLQIISQTADEEFLNEVC